MPFLCPSEFPAVSVLLVTHCTVSSHTLNTTETKGTGSPMYAMQARVFFSREYWMDIRQLYSYASISGICSWLLII